MAGKHLILCVILLFIAAPLYGDERVRQVQEELRRRAFILAQTLASRRIGNHHMCVRAAKAEGVDAGEPAALAARQRMRSRRDLEVQIAERSQSDDA